MCGKANTKDSGGAGGLVVKTPVAEMDRSRGPGLDKRVCGGGWSMVQVYGE